MYQQDTITKELHLQLSDEDLAQFELDVKETERLGHIGTHMDSHPASCSHGLNLQQGGHIIIWFGLTWNWEYYAQANERLNRPGQQHVCRVYHLILQGTHDARVLQALKNKESGNQRAIDALKMEVLGR